MAVRLDPFPPGRSVSFSTESPKPPHDGAAALIRLASPARSVVSFPPMECPCAPIRVTSTSGCCSRKVKARRAAISTRNQLLFRGDSTASSVNNSSGVRGPAKWFVLLRCGGCVASSRPQSDCGPLQFSWPRLILLPPQLNEMPANRAWRKSPRCSVKPTVRRRGFRRARAVLPLLSERRRTPRPSMALI